MHFANIFLTLLAVLTISYALDEDFAFDSSEEVDTQTWTSELANVDMYDETVVGRTYKLKLPSYSLRDKVIKYEAKLNGKKPLPSWLLIAKSEGLLWGIPSNKDVGNYRITIKCHTAKDVDITELYIKVLEDEEVFDCTPGTQSLMILKINIAKDWNSVEPKQRLISTTNIAKFFSLPDRAFRFYLLTQQSTNGPTIKAGPGSLQSRHLKPLSSIEVLIGENGSYWNNTIPIAHHLKAQAVDGTVEEVLSLPVVGWKIVEEACSPRSKRQIETGSGDDLGNSGDGDDGYIYETYDDYDYSDSEDSFDQQSSTTTTTTQKITSTITTSTVSESTTEPGVTEIHPHRHHHGETQSSITSTSSKKVISTTSSTVEHHSVLTNTDFNDGDEEIDIYEDYEDESVTIIPVVTNATEAFNSKTDETTSSKTEETKESLMTSTQSTTSNTEEGIESVPETSSSTTSTSTQTTVETIPSVESTIDESEKPDGNTSSDIVTSTIASTSTTSVVKLSETEPPLTTTEMPGTSLTTIIDDLTTTHVETSSQNIYHRIQSTTEPNDTTPEKPPVVKQTTLRHVPTTYRPTTHVVTESIIYEVKNFAPTLQNRLNRLAATAGKVFSYVIPNDTFTDLEDGNNLQLEFLDSEERPIGKQSWCQFNQYTKEIYGLPMEEDVSRWTYTIRATDKEGSSVTDQLEILVQHHKSRRAVNHEFSLYIQLEKKWEFPRQIDWPLKVLHGLKEIYHLSNLSDITVRIVDYKSVPAVFTWTNDSLPKHFCPKEQLESIFKVLTINNEGDPTHTLIRLLAPELRVKKVLYKGLGICEPKSQPQPPQQPITPPTNFSPILRNPVDHINATIGKLLIYKVPDDTFYDPEDTDPRNLKMSLLTADRQPILVDNWLQFDEKNKEFYGVPLEIDIGSKEYQLICKDSGGLSASDSLIVAVHPGHRYMYNVEFRISLLTEYEKFSHSASMKRKFIEKIKELFGDKHTNHIQLKSIKSGQNGATAISWYNTSLKLEHCPREEIRRLGSILVNAERQIASRVQYIMDPEFPVSSIQLEDLGVCKRQSVETPTAEHPPVPVDETTSNTSHDEYLVTFIVPAIIIAAMLLLAGVFACILYRRRRTGKMNVDEDGRATYGNKGIPVIFQEELEEKPESGTKAPIILKDEKPPLAPPEYSKSGSLKLTDDSEPYQPPPPVARMQENGRQLRPKPTPTYRKPPPYVPP